MTDHPHSMHADNPGGGTHITQGKKAPRAVIGLEIHCQMTSLKSKLFCPCKADYRGMSPNTNVCPICMGLPGSMPRLNREAVCNGLVIAMALNCSIPEHIAFFRKNYFYPDLPKNFQITQLNLHGDVSIGGSGDMQIDGKKIRIRRIQLEEDPGRMIYEGPSARNRISLVDYNRAGTSLVEIVTEPDFEGPRQVRNFLQMLSGVVENLGVCDPALEGAMRADANVSLEGGNRVEIKNINSFHDLEKAVIFEIARQEAQYSRGLEILQETRHWDASRRITIQARLKEEDMDYRYLPEADIPWVVMDADTLETLQGKMPESVTDKRSRYEKKYNIPPQVAGVLSSEKAYSQMFEAACTDANAKELANIITTDLMGMLGAHGVGNGDGDNGGSSATTEKQGTPEEIPTPIAPGDLRLLADAVASGRMARNSARQVLHEMLKTGKGFEDVASGSSLSKMSDESELGEIILHVIKEEKDVVLQAASNPNAVNYLVGKVMQKTRGRADPQVTMSLLRQKISES